jgi:uncharacterized protein YcbK (DUF882 family)
MTPFFRTYSALSMLIWLVLALCIGTDAAADERPPPCPHFRYSGDGRLHLFNAKTGAVFNGVYRHPNGSFDAQALKAMQRVFDAPPEEPLAAVSLRLISFLDYLEAQLKPGARIEIASGWRSPVYNARLAAAGRPAVSASLHLYGKAADIRLEGVDSKRVWHFVRDVGFGGTGYYQGRLVHVDVGPTRFWDQASSGVGTDISTDNKLICLVTAYDRYRPGDPVVLRFVRMTGFPIGVDPRWELQRINEDGTPQTVAPFRPTFAAGEGDHCPQFADIGALMHITGSLPSDLPPGNYAIRARFCESQWEAMPAAVRTPIFEVIGR